MFGCKEYNQSYFSIDHLVVYMCHLLCCWKRLLCNIVLYSIRIYFHHQAHPQLDIVFTLAASLQSFWCYFYNILQSHIGHLLTWRVHLSVLYLFAFSYCSSGSQGKNTERFAIPFSSGPCFFRTLHYDLSFLSGPTKHGSSFH